MHQSGVYVSCTSPNREVAAEPAYAATDMGALQPTNIEVLLHLQASAGLSYSFSVYAPSIKDTLGLSQTEIATVGSAVNLGGYFAIISGSVYDMLKEQHRLGPRLVVWLGSLTCFCGYMGMYLMASGKAPSNFGQLLLFAIAAGNAGMCQELTPEGGEMLPQSVSAGLQEALSH